jgi:hypothetical protein
MQPELSSMCRSSLRWYGKGLKIPFDLMVHFAGVDHLIYDEQRTPILTGIRTALVPIGRFRDSSVQWHFVVAPEDDTSSSQFRWFQHHPDFEKMLPPKDKRFHNAALDDLKGTAYVGWSPTDVEVVLGVKDPPNPLSRSNLPQIKFDYVHSGRDFQSGLQVTPVPFVGSLFSVTKKFSKAGFGSRFTPSQNACALVDQLYSKQVVIYDDGTKTGHLSLLINLVLSLVRGYLKYNGYSYNREALTFPHRIQDSRQELRTLQFMHVDHWQDPGPTFGDIFKHITYRYSAVHDLLPQAARWSETKILGFEIADILANNDCFFPRKLKISNGWNIIAEFTDVVFCRDFGEITVFAGQADVVPRCLQTPPSGHNILVCPLDLLKKHFDFKARNCFGQRGRQDILWSVRGNPFEVCRRSGSCNGIACWASKLQYIENLGWIDRFRRHKDLPCGDITIELEGDGAVCFGRLSEAEWKDIGTQTKQDQSRAPALTPSQPPIRRPDTTHDACIPSSRDRVTAVR